MHDASIVLIAAFALDMLLGDPVYRLHPVRLIGGLIRSIECGLRRLRADGVWGGAVLLALPLLVVVALQQGLRFSLACVSPVIAMVFDAYVLYSCIALRDMLRHASPIAAALLRGDTAAARQHLQKIVGRDVAALDAAAVARATVESVAESFVDGFLAPLFWYGVGCLVAAMAGATPLPFGVGAALAYRCVNTLDSMVGYRNERYLHLGRISARADDVLNLFPARLSLGALWLGAVALRLDAAAGWRIALRDRLKHASPNSAHAESFVAGALGIRLGGPTVYAHGTVGKPWLGDSPDAATPAHIRSCGQLVLATGGVATVVCLLLIEVLT